MPLGAPAEDTLSAFRDPQLYYVISSNVNALGDEMARKPKGPTTALCDERGRQHAHCFDLNAAT